MVKVKETLETDILGMKHKKWDPQVSFERGVRAPSLHRQALVDIRHGLLGNDRPVTLIKDNTDKIYMGTVTRDNYRDWNISTEPVTPRTKHKSIVEE